MASLESITGRAFNCISDAWLAIVAEISGIVFVIGIHVERIDLWIRFGDERIGDLGFGKGSVCFAGDCCIRLL